MRLRVTASTSKRPVDPLVSLAFAESMLQELGHQLAGHCYVCCPHQLTSHPLDGP